MSTLTRIPPFAVAAAILAAGFLAGPSDAAAQGDPCRDLSTGLWGDHTGEVLVFTGVDHANRAFTLTQNPDTGTWALWAVTQFKKEEGGLEIGQPCVVIAGADSKLLTGAAAEAVAAAEAPEEPDPQPAPAEAAVAEATPVEETFKVVGIRARARLDLRSGPGTDNASLVQMAPGSSGVVVGSCRTVDGYRHPWCEVTWQGTEGWASACCLEGEVTGRRPN
jgi:hypothetical protein